jgi:hypothetical protein
LILKLSLSSPSTDNPIVVVGAVLFPELEEACTVPVGETCTDSVLLDDVVIGGEAVEREEAAVVCGRAKAGTSKELNTIILARMLKEAIAGDAAEGSKTGGLQVTQGTVKRANKPFVQVFELFAATGDNAPYRG